MSTTITTDVGAQPSSRTWLSSWTPEDPAFWDTTAKPLAWKTLVITTLNLMMAFIVWFVVSALVVRLPNIGFKLTANQTFWLAAMPGLAAAASCAPSTRFLCRCTAPATSSPFPRCRC